MVLRAGYVDLALQIQEAATSMSHSDIHSRLSDALNDKLRGTGNYGYINDVFGDDESGDVVYSRNGDMKKATYSMGKQEGKPMCSIDFDNEKDVVPVTHYQEEADEDDDADHLASMESEKLYTTGTNIRAVERYISKSDRDAMPKEDFAGKGTSFPIKTAEDVEAAARSIGRAGSGNYSMSKIKARIIAIAKRKGFESALPKAWRESKTTEAATSEPSGLKLRESCGFPIDITLREAFGGSHKIKIIAPGKGSSAFYPAEVLKRDGPKVFRAGTPMRIDHPTRADEAARPEGSVKDWGAVLATDAVWLDEHKQGPGLYAEVKPFSDHAQLIEEKGAYAGVSIRANGNALYENGKPVIREGLPVLAEFTSAEGVDMVTRAGAGGMFLSESVAVPPNSHEVEMTKEEIALVVREAVTAAVAPFKQERLVSLAARIGAKVLSGVSLNDDQKEFAIEEAIRHEIPVLESGAIDEEKFGQLVIEEAKRVARLVGGGDKVRGLGVSATEAGKGKKDCPDCEGSGKDGGADCETCEGSGKVMKESRSPRHSEEAEEKALIERSRKAFGMSEAAAEIFVKGRS